ncbi:MAG: T9SS type A sorting domain-containing protein, partial [Chitinophagales bacterium]
FDNTFNVSNSLEFGWSVLITPDSNYITLCPAINLITNSGSYSFSSFSQSGNIIDNKLYVTSGYFAYVGLMNTLFRLPNHTGYMFGGSLENNLTGDNDIMLVKFNNSGDTIFQKVYSDSNFSAPYYSTITSDSKVLLVGFEGPYSDSKDIFLMKTDTNGNLIWKKNYGDLTNDLGYSVCEMLDSIYVIGGTKIQNGNANPWIIKTDTAGDMLYEKEFTENPFSCGTIWVFPSLDKQFLVHGCLDTIVNNGDYYRPSYIGKMDTNFNYLWYTIFNDPQVNDIYIMKQMADSTVVYVGFQVGGNPNAPEGKVGKLAKNGNKLWEHQYRHGNSTWNFFSDFQQTYDGGFIITGSSDGPTGQDLWLVKLDSLGCLEPCFTNTGTIETGNSAVLLECYPNPSSSQTSILYNVPDAAKQAELWIMDLSGKLLKQVPLDNSANHYNLSLTQWSTGVYVCSLVIDKVVRKSMKVAVAR